MSNISREIRREVLNSNSALRGHSMNQRVTAEARRGDASMYGDHTKPAKVARRAQRQLDNEGLKAELRNGVDAIFTGNPSVEDVVAVLAHLSEFESVDLEEPSASILDLT